jgi:hypothetical protein
MKKKSRMILGLFCLLITGFLLGPALVHLCYRAATTPEEKAQKKKTYFELANAEFSMTAEALQKSQHERREIYYWFHSRGWDIDEGHEAPPFAESWRLLFQYWNAKRK